MKENCWTIQVMTSKDLKCLLKTVSFLLPMSPVVGLYCCAHSTHMINLLGEFYYWIGEGETFFQLYESQFIFRLLLC